MNISSCKGCKEAIPIKDSNRIICKKYGWVITIELAETQQVCAE